MSPDDATVAFIIDAQIKLFDDARHDLQLTIVNIAEQAKLPPTTVNAWAQGRNMLSLWGVKKLLRVKGLAPLLSRLFEPEEFALVGTLAGIDYDEFAEGCRAFLADKDRFHHPESENGRDLGPKEEAHLGGNIVSIRGGAAA